MKPGFVISNNSNDTVTITNNCFKTKKPFSVTVKKVELEQYEAGATAQKAFPKLPAAEREFLISGISPEGWELMFGKED